MPRETDEEKRARIEEEERRALSERRGFDDGVDALRQQKIQETQLKMLIVS